MRIGIVSIWCNRGQATVSRHLRSAFEALGHQTFVLARPTRAPAGKSPLLSREGVWDQPGITETRQYEISGDEYSNWAENQALDAIWFDQNYQFEHIRDLRKSGILTIGRFVWEQFSRHHLDAALEAFSVIYSMTACEQERYREWGVDSPRVRYGCHPELFQSNHQSDGGIELSEEVRFFFPATGQRKLIALTLNAFRRFAPPQARLIFKGHAVRNSLPSENEFLDERIQVCATDLSFSDYHQILGNAHVCLAPSRWEGLGLHLFEALAHDLPTVSIDFAPVNEVVTHNINGYLVPALADGKTKSGLTAWRCDEAALGQAIAQICNPTTLRKLTQGAAERRAQLTWDNTIADVQTLLGRGTG